MKTRKYIKVKLMYTDGDNHKEFGEDHFCNDKNIPFDQIYEAFEPIMNVDELLVQDFKIKSIAPIQNEFTLSQNHYDHPYCEITSIEEVIYEGDFHGYTKDISETLELIKAQNTFAKERREEAIERTKRHFESLTNKEIQIIDSEREKANELSLISCILRENVLDEGSIFQSFDLIFEIALAFYEKHGLDEAQWRDKDFEETVVEFGRTYKETRNLPKTKAIFSEDHQSIKCAYEDCDSWESMGIDDPRKHFSHIELSVWHPTKEEQNEHSVHYCHDCNRKILVEWDYKNYLETEK